MIRIDQAQFLDPRWRLSNLYTITDKTGTRVPFRPNSAQMALLDDLHSANIILKARQLGFTTLCCLIYLDACIFTPNTRAGVIAHKLDDAKVIFRDKIKYPYDQLDEGLKAAAPALQDSADTLTFANNSSIRVSTSMRSGTLQYLHVSEFGKICAQYPEKAREIVTGALNTVEAGQFIVIESTAEGQEGAFYRMCQEAREHASIGKPLSLLDWKFHFFAWWKDSAYSLNEASIPIGEEYKRYFERLEDDGIMLTPGQKAWYVKKDKTLGGDMRREYPSTPDEAFEQALEGAYFAHQLSAAAKQGRIGGFPLDPRAPVNTFWDLGRNDQNVIWLHQWVTGYHRFVGYYENSGEFIGHYISWLREWARERDVVFGDHYVPHDGDRESLWLEQGTMGVMQGLGFRPRVVERPKVKGEAIASARAIFPTCQFDEAACDLGLKRLRHYRKEWDDDHGVWKDRPRHDDNSHGADAFLTFACSDYQPPRTLVFKQRDMSWVV
jgi:hypothetical protein